MQPFTLSVRLTTAHFRRSRAATAAFNYLARDARRGVAGGNRRVDSTIKDLKRFNTETTFIKFVCPAGGARSSAGIDRPCEGLGGRSRSASRTFLASATRGLSPEHHAQRFFPIVLDSPEKPGGAGTAVRAVGRPAAQGQNWAAA